VSLRLSQVTDAVIPVAGLGTRLLPATRSQPKEMLPVVDKPVVQYVVEELVRAGIGRVLFVTGRRKRAIEDHFDADPELNADPLIDPRTGLRLLYTRQAHPGGLGDAVRYGEGLSPDRGVVVALGDTIIAPPTHTSPAIVPRLIEAYERHQASAVLAVEEVPQAAVSRYGIVIGERRGEVIEVEDVVREARSDGGQQPARDRRPLCPRSQRVRRPARDRTRRVRRGAAHRRPTATGARR
jgi:UTP--glucose-1-phosphate uridylyltransferase